MKTKLLIVVGALALVFVAAARAQDCTTQTCIYLPAAQLGSGATANPQSAPTVTPLSTDAPPIVGTVPIGTNGCELATPAPIEGAQAWVVSLPQGIFTRQQLCVRVLVQGRFYYNFTTHFVLHTRTQDWAFEGSANSATGVAQFILGAPDSVPGDTVQIDVAVPYLDRIYLVHTSYVIAIQPTLTPIPSATPTNVPPTSTSTPTNTPSPPTATATNVPPTATATETPTP